MKICTDKLTEYFTYLDILRESGATNMFGASPYLDEAFDLNKGEAQKIVGYWMKTFNKDQTPTERANSPLLE